MYEAFVDAELPEILISDCAVRADISYFEKRVALFHAPHGCRRHDSARDERFTETDFIGKISDELYTTLQSAKEKIAQRVEVTGE